MEDEEAVRRILRGDREAAALLHERYLPLLRGRVRRRLNGKVRRRVAESDVIQEAFIAVMNRLDDFEDRGPGSFGRWLGSVLDHKILDQLRKHVGASKRSIQHEETRASAHDPDVHHGDHETPSQVIATDDAVRSVHDAMKTLPEDYQRVLRLVHFEGVSLDDAALSMERSTEAVRRLYGRAVSRLRTQLPE